MIGETLTQYGPHRLFGSTIGDRDRRPVGFRIGGDAGPEERPDDRPRDIRGSFRRRDQLRKIQAQGSGTGVLDRVRRYAITSARCSAVPDRRSRNRSEN